MWLVRKYFLFPDGAQFFQGFSPIIRRLLCNPRIHPRRRDGFPALSFIFALTIWLSIPGILTATPSQGAVRTDAGDRTDQENAIFENNTALPNEFRIVPIDDMTVIEGQPLTVEVRVQNTYKFCSASLTLTNRPRDMYLVDNSPGLTIDAHWPEPVLGKYQVTAKATIQLRSESGYSCGATLRSSETFTITVIEDSTGTPGETDNPSDPPPSDPPPSDPPPSDPPPPDPPPSNPPSGPVPTTPDMPMYLRATAGNKQVTLTWDPPHLGADGIIDYSYCYKQSNQIWGFDAPRNWENIPGGKDARSYTVTNLTNGLEYTFEVRAENADGGGSPASTTVTLPSSGGSGGQSSGQGTPLSVHTENEELPTGVALMGNYPNPFHTETTIGYVLPQASGVRLVVYDLLGHEMIVLVDGFQPAGRHAVRFAASDLPSGPYVYRLQAGNKIITRSMMLVK